MAQSTEHRAQPRPHLERGGHVGRQTRRLRKRPLGGGAAAAKGAASAVAAAGGAKGAHRRLVCAAAQRRGGGGHLSAPHGRRWARHRAGPMATVPDDVSSSGESSLGMHCSHAGKQVDRAARLHRKDAPACEELTWNELCTAAAAAAASAAAAAAAASLVLGSSANALSSSSRSSSFLSRSTRRRTWAAPSFQGSARARRSCLRRCTAVLRR